jgi:hypothetical protein
MLHGTANEHFSLQTYNKIKTPNSQIDREYTKVSLRRLISCLGIAQYNIGEEARRVFIIYLHSPMSLQI